MMYKFSYDRTSNYQSGHSPDIINDIDSIIEISHNKNSILGTFLIL